MCIQKLIVLIYFIFIIRTRILIYVKIIKLYKNQKII